MNKKIWIIIILLGSLAPFVVYPVFMMKLLCFALFASAFNLLLGYTGLLSFGHAAFFGGASYITGHLVKNIGASAAAGATVQTLAHPLPGAEGEALALDVARVGGFDLPRLLVISSACHGVEGHCGSGVQHALLSQAAFLQEAQAAGVALLLVHALNPHGFLTAGVSRTRVWTSTATSSPSMAWTACTALPTQATTPWPLCWCRPAGRPAPRTQPRCRPTRSNTASVVSSRPSAAGSTATRWACSTAAARPPGAAWPSSVCCASTVPACSAWPG